MRRQIPTGNRGTAGAGRRAARSSWTPLQVGSVVTLFLVAGTGALVFGPWSSHSVTFGDAMSTVASVLAAGCCWYTAKKSTGAGTLVVVAVRQHDGHVGNRRCLLVD